MQVELVDIQCAIRSVANVLISRGDCAGRTRLARFIHEQGPQRYGPMVVLGPGWTSQPPEGSTLFIEELTALDDTAQDELMRLLSSRRPFTDEMRETRIISATAHNLLEPLSWPFNMDLFYRLNTIHVPLGDPMPQTEAHRRPSPSLTMVH